MSHLYSIRRDGFKYQELDLEVRDFAKSFPENYSYHQAHYFSVENIAMKDFWPPMRTGFSKIQGQENLIPDITTWICASLLLSPKAYRFLGETLSPFGEFLPILIESGDNWEEYQIFNCLTLADVIEEECSDTNMVFNPESIKDKLIFKTTFHNCLYLYCQERLKDVVESFGLNGVIFDSHLGTFAE